MIKTESIHDYMKDTIDKIVNTNSISNIFSDSIFFDKKKSTSNCLFFDENFFDCASNKDDKDNNICIQFLSAMYFNFYRQKLKNVFAENNCELISEFMEYFYNFNYDFTKNDDIFESILDAEKIKELYDIIFASSNDNIEKKIDILLDDNTIYECNIKNIQKKNIENIKKNKKKDLADLLNINIVEILKLVIIDMINDKNLLNFFEKNMDKLSKLCILNIEGEKKVVNIYNHIHKSLKNLYENNFSELNEKINKMSNEEKKFFKLKDNKYICPDSLQLSHDVIGMLINIEPIQVKKCGLFVKLIDIVFNKSFRTICGHIADYNSCIIKEEDKMKHNKIFREKLLKIINLIYDINDHFNDINNKNNIGSLLLLGFLQYIIKKHPKCTKIKNILFPRFEEKKETIDTNFENRFILKSESYLVHYDKSHGYPDCVETELRNLINIGIINKFGKLNIEDIKNEHAKKYYTTYDSIDKHFSQTARDDWFLTINKIINENGLNYMIKNKKIESVTSNKNNTIKLLGLIFNINDNIENNIEKIASKNGNKIKFDELNTIETNSIIFSFSDTHVSNNIIVDTIIPEYIIDINKIINLKKHNKNDECILKNDLSYSHIDLSNIKDIKNFVKIVRSINFMDKNLNKNTLLTYIYDVHEYLQKSNNLNNKHELNILKKYLQLYDNFYGTIYHQLPYVIDKNSKSLQLFYKNISPFLINKKNYLGETPLHISIKHKYYDIADILIDKKADVNAITDTHSSPLEYAVKTENPNLHIIKKLIDNKANINMTNDDGITPISISVNLDNIETTKLLLENNADTNISDNNKHHSIFYAIKNNNVEIAKLLLENKAKLDTLDAHNHYPIYYAILDNDTDMVELLLKFGSPIQIDPKINTKPKYKNMIEIIESHKLHTKGGGLNYYEKKYYKYKKKYIILKNRW